MTRFYTFEHVDRPSKHTPEWITFRFSNGCVSVLTRDKVRSTRKVWETIGNYATINNCRVIGLSENSFGSRLAATTMIRKWGATVLMPAGKFADNGEFGSVACHDVTKWNGRITNPNTIRNKGTQVRRTSLDLGLKPASGATHGNSKPKPSPYADMPRTYNDYVNLYGED